MGNGKLKPEIIQLLEEGWTPRIKTVKGHRYITLRKGKKEKSLGPHNEELWNQLKALIPLPKFEQRPLKKLEIYESLKALSHRVEDLESELKWLKSRPNVGEEKATQCNHIKSWYGRKFCGAWGWEKKPSTLIAMFPNVFFKRNKMGGESLWRFTPHQDICMACTRFMETDPSDEYEIARLNERISQLEPTVKLLKSSAQRRVRDDHHGCTHMGQDGYCTWWHYYERQWDRDQKEDLIIEGGRQMRVWRDNVKKNPEVCASCPSYSPKEAKL